MYITSLTQKGQATIPAQVRKLLKLKPGDMVKYSVDNNKVTLSKASIADQQEMKSLSKTLEAEWSSQADEDAYADL